MATEAANGAHVDVLGALLTVCGLGVLARARTTGGAVRGGVLLGLAVATKLTPVLALPGTLRRRPIAVAVASASAFVAVYVPHVIAVGGKVIGFLPGYLQEEGYDDGNRSVLLDLLVPDRYSTYLAAAILAVTALIAYRCADPDRPWRAATVVTGTALLATTPSYPWYAILLVVLVALDGRIEWLAVARVDLPRHRPGPRSPARTGPTCRSATDSDSPRCSPRPPYAASRLAATIRDPPFPAKGPPP